MTQEQSEFSLLLCNGPFLAEVREKERKRKRERENSCLCLSRALTIQVDALASVFFFLLSAATMNVYFTSYFCEKWTTELW